MRENAMQSEEIRERLTRLETSCLCDAKKTLRCLDPAIRPLSRGVKLVGRAFTVSCCNDFLTVIKALHDAAPGDVLVVDGQQGRTALAGELFATEAKRKGLSGIVVDGAVRDVATIRAMHFPVYCRTIFPLSGSTAHIFTTQVPVSCGGVTVVPGNIVFGDDDGIVVASEAEISEVLPLAEAIQQKEAEALQRMAHGESLLRLFNFDEHLAFISEGKASQLRFV
jgi:4-hydroxy-4-methyl-2-oxoglutarate aldolase